MKTPQFLEYLNRNAATETLAVEFAELLALRGRPDLVPPRWQSGAAGRIAS